MRIIAPLAVYRYVNVFYFILFLIYCVIFLIFIIPRRKDQPYKNAFRVFYCTFIVGLAMEVYGTISSMRIFYIGGQHIIAYQLLIDVAIGLGEGGTATAIIYLMVEAFYQKDYKKYFLYMVSMAVLILTFASFTYFYKNY